MKDEGFLRVYNYVIKFSYWFWMKRLAREVDIESEIRLAYILQLYISGSYVTKCSCSGS